MMDGSDSEDEESLKMIDDIKNAKAIEEENDTLKNGIPLGIEKKGKKCECCKNVLFIVVLSTVLCGYTIGGAFLFNWLEQKAYIDATVVDEDKLDQAILDIVTELWNDSKTMDRGTWIEYARAKLMSDKANSTRFLDDNNSTKTIFENIFHESKPWNIWKATIYCLTVYTTIGYGHIVPVTDGGKLATIIYGTIGIPLFIVVLAKCGEVITTIIKGSWGASKRCWRMMCRKIKIRKRKALKITASDEGSAEQAPTLFVLLITIGYMFGGALLYQMWEDWSYLDSFYFLFISLSTIGFGDILPEEEHIFVLTSLYIIFGLALLSSVLVSILVELGDRVARKTEAQTKKLMLGVMSELNDPKKATDLVKSFGNKGLKSYKKASKMVRRKKKSDDNGSVES